MATSLLRLGRLGSVKCLLRECGGTPKTPFVAALCTKADAPPKTAKKPKASSKSKTIEADERASLLAYKPAVAFPSKLSATGFLLKDVALGESEAEAVSTVTANQKTTDIPATTTDVAVEEPKITEGPPADEPTPEAVGSKTLDVKAEVQKDEETSSSSSSDSDSDSDSDDEKPKTETTEQPGEKAEETKASGLTTEQVSADKEAKSESIGEAHKSAETVTKATPEVPTPSSKPADSAESLVDPAPILSSSTTEAIHEVSSESIAVTEKIVDTATEVKMAPTEEIVEKEPEIKSEVVPEVTTEASLEEVAEATVEASPEEVAKTIVEASPEEVPKTSVEASPEEVAKSAAEASPEDVAPEASGDVAAKPEDPSSKPEAGTLAVPSEELVDPAPVAADAVEALTQTDVVETPEEQAPEKAPAPEPEPFDNTSYKNLQHHNYNLYTFYDVDVEMSKSRLPQPSSGRPSPRH